MVVFDNAILEYINLCPDSSSVICKKSHEEAETKEGKENKTRVADSSSKVAIGDSEFADLRASTARAYTVI